MRPGWLCQPRSDLDRLQGNFSRRPAGRETLGQSGKGDGYGVRNRALPSRIRQRRPCPQPGAGLRTPTQTTSAHPSSVRRSISAGSRQFQRPLRATSDRSRESSRESRPLSRYKSIRSLVSNLRRDNCFWPLDHYLLHRSGVAYSLMKILPVDRALSIYGALADRSETYIEGEKDKHRPTVEGLSYLRKLDREIDSRS